MACSSSAVKYPCFFFFLVVLVLLVPGLLAPSFYTMVKATEKEAQLISQDLNHQVVSEIERITHLLSPANSSAANLARILNSSLDGGNLSISFSTIETSVAPGLFQALSTVPHLSQVAYIGSNGLFFSYYISGNRTSAVYSNSSRVANVSLASSSGWYTQPVNRNNGKLYGEATSFRSLFTINSTSLLEEALNSTDGHASLGTGFGQDLLFFNTVGLDGKGAISLGFSAEPLTHFFSSIEIHGGNLYLASKDGRVLTAGIASHSVSFEFLNANRTQKGHVGNVTCEANNSKQEGTVLNIGESNYMIYCSPLDILGVKLAYVLALPQREVEGHVHNTMMYACVLLPLMGFGMAVLICAFVYFIVGAAQNEMRLRARLIKQMEATQQAERKSLNKSLTFATASHDIRALLAGITGLVEMCHDEVPPGSELDTNLTQVERCTKDLLGILNSILDASKIEAGKMQLEEEEFDLAQLLEDVVDLYHPVGMKKGVDVVLDPCDGSVSRKVKGDRTKLKQVLSNLLSNAVKFTSEGHVAVRAWVRTPSLSNTIFSASPNSSLHCISCLFPKNDDAYSGFESMKSIHENSNCLEVVFEVDDTGLGIPKEKQNAVFENYVQVRKTVPAQEGTGLGLGIVQSLVRLMGGEIGIVDKEIDEKGTCFRFNIFLTTCETEPSGDGREEDIESNHGSVSGDLIQQQHSGPSTCTCTPKREESRVVLFIQSETRQRISQKFMERLGIKVSTVKEWEQLPRTLKNIKQKLNTLYYSTSSRSETSSRSDRVFSPGTRAKGIPLSTFDGTDLIPTPHKRTNLKGVPNFILIVIDINAGPFRELSKAVAEFRRDLHNICCRIVWIDKPGAQNVHSKGLYEDKLPHTDMVISKPLHGSCLYQLIGMLPEFGGALPELSSGKRRQNTNQLENMSSKSYHSTSQAPWGTKSRNSIAGQSHIQQGERQEHGSPSRDKAASWKEALVSHANPGVQAGKIQRHGSTSTENLLNGMRFLVAEDDGVTRKVTKYRVSLLGAHVDLCENGKEAIELVCRGLSSHRKDGATAASLPYDYILMDCEMPVVDGFEATRRIREEEKYYGVHIPIIALTAHTTLGVKETSRIRQVGMDFQLTKPLDQGQLVEAIAYINDSKLAKSNNTDT